MKALLGNPTLFLDSESVGRALLRISGRSDEPKKESMRWRREGLIFGAWDGRHYRYPRFQFDLNGRPLASIIALVELLPRDFDGTGRDAAMWLFAEDAALDGRTPADVFPGDPNRVIRLARLRRNGSPTSD